MTILAPLAPKANSVVIYEGPSMLDGSPIVVIASGLKKSTSNDKTGDMIQTWILRSDMDPNAALKTGADDAICGSCFHRGSDERKRSCYVVVHHAPLSVWRSWNRGNVPTVNPKGIAKDRMVRLGSYGDPAAVPIGVWHDLLSGSTGHTGYTHQWKTCDPSFASIVMASADSEDDLIDAACLGYRAFHVRAVGSVKPKGTMQCPSDPTLATATPCSECKACNGKDSRFTRSVSIMAHGNGAKHVG